MTEQELNQHRKDLQQLDIEQLRCGVMLQLNTIEALTAERDRLLYEVDAIPEIKAERDAWKQSHDEQVAKLIEIANERDALKSSELGLNRYAAKVNSENTALTNERDALKAELARPESTVVSLMRAENVALKDAARLALDALERLLVCSDACTCSGREAIAALKAVL